MELGNHEEANEELELIDAPLRAHPDVLEVRWLIHQKVENWELCENIASALVKLAPERTTGWIHRSVALHEMKRTQEAYDELKPALDTFKKEQLIWVQYGVLRVCTGQQGRGARVAGYKAIELGGDAVKTQALEDPDLQCVWVSGED